MVKADKFQCLGQNISRWSTVLLGKQDRKAFYNMVAKQAGLLLNKFTITAIEEKMRSETPEVYNDMIQQQEKTNPE